MNSSQEIILRVKSAIGTSRISINKNATLADLKAEVFHFKKRIQNKINVFTIKRLQKN